MSRFRALVSMALAASVQTSVVFAQTDTTFTYQGRLDEQGVPANGAFNLDFELFDALSGGTQVGPDVMFNDHPVVDGLFTVELDFGAAAFDNTNRWLEIAVNGSELSPRQPVTRVPYSIQTRGIFVDADHSVGIGTNTPDFPLHVESSGTPLFAHATAASGNTNAGHFTNESSAGTGVKGEATASNNIGSGVHGVSNGPGGAGVFGEATASGGFNYGVRGVSESTSGRGVYGRAFASTGTTYGGQFESNSTTGLGVFGEATAGTGITYGGWFKSRSTVGRGLFGLANATSGVNYGVVGHSNSSSGFDFWASGAGTNYGAPSSRRWKSNVVPIGDPLDKLAQLRGVYFDWDHEHGGAHDVGMIAEVVGAVMPEIVQYEENGVDAIGMDYSKMTPLLVEAVNALRAEKDSEIQVLRAEKDDEIAALNTRILALERLMTRPDSISMESDD